MTELDLPWSVSQGAGGIAEKDFLLFRADQTEEQARLGVVVVIIGAIVPVVGSSLQG